ncbi:MAG TPA: hypothetical protein VGD65_23050 [Chryseosolibacter sp.]
MKTYVAVLLLLFPSVAITSFDHYPATDEMSVLVTSGLPTKFSLYNNGKVVDNLVTPYRLTVKASEGRFIFKALDGLTALKVTAQKSGTKVMGEWPVTVLLVQHEEMSTFGMD